jgi:dihydrofolate reductase
MVTKCSVFIATSLDGFISRPDGSIDWLEQTNARVPAGEDCGYEQFIDGGVTIQRFLAAGLIDEITITRIPVLIGAGRPLFGP